MRKSIFLKNTLILTVTAFLLRALGIVLRVYMSNSIGTEGMGLYQLIFSIYALATTFATAGISTAIIRIISEELVSGNRKSILKLLHKSILISTLLGFIATFSVYFSADVIGKYWLNDVRTIPSLKILSFAFPFMSISSCIKGYFIGLRKVSVPSNAQLFEQVIRICLIFFLLKTVSPYGISMSCAAILIGDVISQICSCLYCYIFYLSGKKNLPNKIPSTVKNKAILPFFFSIALPVAATKYVNSILHTIENLLVPHSLALFNSSREKSLEQFGMLKGMALPLLFFPSSFLGAISTLLIPEMSEANVLHQKEKVRRVVNRVLQLTLTMSILIGGLFYLLAYDLSALLYNNLDVGLIIKVLAPLVPFMYLESMVSGMLQGLNQQMSSLRYIISDSILRIILVYFCVPLKGLPVFLFIMFISNVSTSCLNTHKLLKVADVKIDWANWIIKPLISFSMSSIILLLIVSHLSCSSIIYLAITLIVICPSYLLFLLIIKAVTKKDLIY